ncbi:hypothetical protein EV561_106187 [Rhizobium sp. BK376]|nr:hypothetical protein EV561_106187 [Rhizobium sp. BK376]
MKKPMASTAIMILSPNFESTVVSFQKFDGIRLRRRALAFLYYGFCGHNASLKCTMRGREFSR